MPWGKYGPANGDHRLMKDIPAKYLLWLWDNVLWNTEIPAQLPVREYVKGTLKVLESEEPDYILQHKP